MFCGKCGFKMKNAEIPCPRCGWQPVKTDRTRTASDSGSNGFAGYEVADIPDPQPPRNEYVKPAVPNYYTQPQDNYQDDARIPTAYRAAPEKKDHSKAIIITLICIATALIIALGVVFGVRYFGKAQNGSAKDENSEEYRIERAEDEILDGNYDEALSRIEDIRTEQADAMRKFVSLKQAVDKYQSVYHADEFVTSVNTSDSAADLIDSFSKLPSDLPLPEKLRAKYDLYQARRDAMQSCAVDTDDLAAAQKCVWDFKQRKEGASFTVSDLNNAIGVSEPAVQKLEAVLKSDSYIGFAATGCPAVSTMQSFFEIVSNQVSQDKFDRDNYVRDGFSYSNLKLTGTVANYDASVGTGLKSLQNESDIQNNADALSVKLKAAWTAYVFEIV